MQVKRIEVDSGVSGVNINVHVLHDIIVGILLIVCVGKGCWGDTSRYIDSVVDCVQLHTFVPQ